MRRTIVLAAIIAVLLCGCGDAYEVQDNPDNSYLTEEFTSANAEVNESETPESVEEDIEINSESEINLESTSDYILSEEEFNKVLTEIRQEILNVGDSKNEILFNNIPWGENYLYASEIMNELEGVKSVYSLLKWGVPTIDRILGGYTSPTPEDAGGSCAIFLSDMNVAGYEVSDCYMSFVNIAQNDESGSFEENSALFLAGYAIEINDQIAATEDLINKISSLYGEPDKSVLGFDCGTGHNADYTYWYGSNMTILVLASERDLIKLSYVWLGGEELIQNAIQNILNEQQEQENEIYGNGDTFGL